MSIVQTSAIALAPLVGTPLLAEQGPPSMLESMGSLPIMMLIIGLFWFLLIRPEGKKDKLRRERLDKLEVGSKVVLNGGLLGEITKLEAQVANVRLGKGVTVSVIRKEILDTQEGKLKALESDTEEKK